MTYGIFWLDERIVDSHNIDLTMLDPVVGVSTWSGPGPDWVGEVENLRVTEDL